MNKKLLSLAFFAFLLGLFAEKTSAQASGLKPELFMYRHNGSLGSSPSPAVTGDILGTIQWRGLTAIGSVLHGATIRSEATNVSPGILRANLIFRTSGTLGLLDRMIITDEGRVGIGTNTPSIVPHDFKLHVVGNTHTTGRFHGRIHFDENQPTGLPNTYVDEAYFEQKNRTALDAGAGSLPINATYPVGGILTLAPGGGGIDRQIFSGGNDGIWTRSQNLLGGNSWEAWYRFLTSEDINGRPNLGARFLPPDNPSSKLGDGQIFDNGSNVVIGGIPAAPALPAPTFNASDVLTVQGDARMEDNLAVEGDAAVTGSTTTGTLSVGTTANVGGLATVNSLSVTNNATVNGNVGIGKAPTGFDLDVAGESNFDGRVKIDATDFPTSTDYKLAVGGGIMAEEVLVRLQPWPDYVFEQGYDLKPLSEVSQFIHQEKHLPGVPSANDIAENGLNLGQMQKMQMEKIEELYLHMIALDKEMREVKLENAALKAKIEQLEKRN